MKPPRATTLWGDGAAPDPQVFAYTVTDRDADTRLLVWDILGSLGHVEGLRASAFLSDREARTITTGLRAALRAAEKGELVIGPEDEDVHSAVERWLSARDPDAGARLHTGRSRNEQVAVDVRLFLKDRLLTLHRATDALAASLLGFAVRHERVLWPGYTHAQRAMPSTAGLWATAWAEGLVETLEAFPALWAPLDRSPLGTGAGYGVPLPIDREATARTLGFADLVVTAPAAQNGRGKLETAALAWCAQLGHDVARLAADAILYGSEEYGFLLLPPSLATGSSLMPQKRNPDVFELTRARAAAVDAELAAVLRLKAGLTGGYHRDLQFLKEPLVRGLDRTEEMVTMMERAVGELAVDRARGRAALEGTLAADEVIARVEAGTPFRRAYRAVASDLARGAAFAPPTDGEILARRTTLGSPGRPGIELVEKRLRTCRRFATAKGRRFHSAMARLAGRALGDGRRPENRRVSPRSTRSR